jgi:glycosidase
MKNRKIKISTINSYLISLLLAVSLTAFYSCKKDEDNPPPGGDNNDPEYFEGVPEPGDVVMYEVNLRALSPGGNLQGVTGKLDHIESLGVNVIWLMPIHPIGEVNSVNSPYSVKDYFEVGAEYGTLDDLKDLVDEAHARDIAVIMDWVANHTAWDNEWITNKSWYTQDGEGNIIHPPGTNWLDVADLNYDNQEMRAAMIEAMMYWVTEAEIDGFRCDYADGVPFDFWQEALATIDSIPGRDFIFFAEGTRDDHFDAGFDLNFGWQFYGAVKNVFNGQPVDRIFSAHADEYSSTPSGKHWIRFTTNHDESAWDATPVSLFNGTDGALAASAVTIFTGGAPLIYGSQEVGTANNVPFFSNSTINWDNNPEMLLSYQKMLQFYPESQVARTGQNTVFQHEDIACFKKSLSGEEMIVMANLRDETTDYPIPAALENTSWTNVMTGNGITLSNQLSMHPYQYLILEKD